MATDSLLPLFHERSADSMAVPSSEPDDVLAELLGGAGEDLLASLLEPGSNYVNEMSSPPLPTTFSTSYSDLGLPDNNTSYNQDGHLGDGSSYVGANTPCTPQSYSSASPVEILGNSPESGSPGDAMMMSSNVIPTDELGVLLGSITSVSSGESSADVRIDVDLGITGRGMEEAASGVTAGQSSSGRKAATLVLTEEEKRLLSAEGVELPTDMPLTKTEQKHLKRVRRKIKNKLSAQESRRKKKEYVEGLEERVETCTNTNNQLRQRVQTLETENKTLLQQLQKLQSVVAQLYPGKLQAGSLLMVLSLCFSLLIWPRPPATPISSSYSVTVHSRSLLFTETDEFGNIIDAESGAIVSEQGGLSPKLPYPWSYQTPAFIYPTTSHTPREL